MIVFKRELLIIIFFFFICVAIKNLSYAQPQPKNLTIIYSNNINAETDPCPTWGERNRIGGLARRATWV